ncbi:MAG TPA: TIM barrel protein [bacterium]|nr:TIM barrel protein [bacterium]
MLARTEFTPQFSVGVWYFSPMGSRFHDRYGQELDIKHRLERIAPLRDIGVVAVEAHYPAEIHEGNLDLWRAFVRDTGIRLLTVIPGLFYDREFEFGSLSSPLPAVRRIAITRAITALQLNRDFETDFAVVWPGIDGYESPLGIDLAAMRARFVEGLAEAMDAVPGVRIAFEPKPYEPRGRILFGTTAEGLLMAQQVESMLRHSENRRLLDEGHALMALNPEAGHMLMGYEDLAYSFSLACEYGRLAHTHWNSQPLGNYDQDLNVGVMGPEQTEAALYALKMHGYSGLFGIDINPERMPAEVGVRNCIDALRAAAERIHEFDHERLLWAADHPDQARGWIEAYLIRRRALHPDRLSPLPRLPGA